MMIDRSAMMKHYAGFSFPEQKEAVNICNLLAMIYAYSMAMFLLDLMLDGHPAFILMEIVVMTLAMAVVFAIWYYGHMDLAIFIAGLYGVGFTLLIYFEDAHMRFDMQLMIVLLVTVIGFRRLYQYVLTSLIVVPLIVLRMMQEDSIEPRYIIFMILSIAITTYMLHIIKRILEREIRTAYALKMAQEEDVLTGLPNRRYFENNVRRKINRQDASVMLIDMDHFKGINDSYGHSVGDQVLMEFAEVLKMMEDGSLQAFRWGGEEFLVVAFGGKDAVRALADSVRAATEAHTFSVPQKVTVSIGIAWGCGDMASPNDCFFKADKALYKAKDSGRNRVVFYSES